MVRRSVPILRSPSNASLAALVYFELFLQRAMIATINIPSWITSEKDKVSIIPPPSAIKLVWRELKPPSDNPYVYFSIICVILQLGKALNLKYTKLNEPPMSEN